MNDNHPKPRIGLYLLVGVMSLLIGSCVAARASGFDCAMVNSPDGLLAVRAGPNTNHPALFQLRNGQRIVITDDAGKWLRVQQVYAGTTSTDVDGWVYGPLLRSAFCPWVKP